MRCLTVHGIAATIKRTALKSLMVVVWAVGALVSCSGGSSDATDRNGGSGKKSTDVTGSSSMSTPPGLLGLTECVASGKGHDYQVGPNAGQLASLNLVPWESLGAGDTVRILYRAEPYRSKFMISAQGTADAPVRICGIKGPKGERPIIDGSGATTRTALANLYGSSQLLNQSTQSASDIHQSRSIIVIKQLTTQAWQAYPSHIQIDGLNIRGAYPSHQFKDANGDTKTYDAFGACIWIDRGKDIVIANNEISDCTNGLFSKSTDDGDFAITKNLRIAGNYIHGNGVVGDEHQHNTYLQSQGVVYEYNRYGPPRTGALGNAIKDRSAGTVIRFNRIEEGAHAIDLVEAEDFAVAAIANVAYRTTLVYGNQIIKSGDSGSFIHYGGDHYDSSPGANWGEPIFRKGTLYFFNNTVITTGSGARLFQLSTTEEAAEVWNNIFVFGSGARTGYRNIRQTTEGLGKAWTPGGRVNLGRNWIDSRWRDSDPYHSIPGQLSGAANLLTGATTPIDLATLIPLAGSAVIDAGVAGPLNSPAADLVNAQLDTSFFPATRSVNGTGIDLGAVEK